MKTRVDRSGLRPRREDGARELRLRRPIAATQITALLFFFSGLESNRPSCALVENAAKIFAPRGAIFNLRASFHFLSGW